MFKIVTIRPDSYTNEERDFLRHMYKDKFGYGTIVVFVEGFKRKISIRNSTRQERALYDESRFYRDVHKSMSKSVLTCVDAGGKAEIRWDDLIKECKKNG